MRKYVNIDSTFNDGMDAWEVEVKDEEGKVLSYTDVQDEDFEATVDELEKKYKADGYTVEINIG